MRGIENYEDWRLRFACHLPFLDLPRESMLEILNSKKIIFKNESACNKNFFKYLPSELKLTIFEKMSLYTLNNFCIAYPENYNLCEKYIYSKLINYDDELKYIIESLLRGDYYSEIENGFNKIVFSCNLEEPNIITSIYEKRYPVVIKLKLIKTEEGLFLLFSKIEKSVYSVVEIINTKLLEIEGSTKENINELVEKIYRKILKNFPEEYTFSFE